MFRDNYTALATTVMDTAPNGSLQGKVPQSTSVDYTAVIKLVNIFAIIIYSLSFVLGAIGNGIVIWFCGFKMKKTVNTVWYLNLAVADFLFTVFLPFLIIYTAMDFHWPFGLFMCKFSSTLSLLNMFTSVYILVLISVDRCLLIMHPVWAQNNRTIRRVSWLSAGVWVFAIIMCTPYFVFRDTVQLPPNVIRCYMNYGETNWLIRYCAISITRYLLGFVVPFTIIVICYAVIIRYLKRKHLGSKQPFTTIAVVISTFFFCWIPYYIFSLIELINYTSVGSETLNTVIRIGMPISVSLAYFNSCVNPFVYVFIGRDFKAQTHKSIQKVLEMAFSDEPTRTTNSLRISRTKDLRSRSSSATEMNNFITL